MCRALVMMAVIAAVPQPVLAQQAATPVPPAKIVDGWTISRTPLGCDARSVAAAFADPYFWVQQNGKQGWDYKPGAAVKAIEDAQFLRTFPRAPVKAYLIDGRRVDAATLTPDTAAAQIAGARQVKLVAEGYVDQRSPEQLRADYAAGRQTTLDNFRWQTASEAIRVPGPAAAAALRTCAAEPREPNRPASIAKRGTGALGALGLSEDRFISLICRDRSFSGKIAPIDFTLAVSADGVLTDLKPAGGATFAPGAVNMTNLLRQSLRMRPATDAAGRFVAGSVAYRSPAVDLDCSQR